MLDWVWGPQKYLPDALARIIGATSAAKLNRVST